MNIHLYPKYDTHNYSTNAGYQNTCSQISSTMNQSQHCSRSRSRQFLTHSRKAFNMNDKQTRLKRQNHQLYQQSTQQIRLFDKGVKKIDIRHKGPKETRSIDRSYRNKQTYDILNPPNRAPKTSVGVKRINLFDQNKQTSHQKPSSNSHRKFIKDHNEKTQAQTQYIIKKLPSHQNASFQWANSHAYVTFNKKANIHNKQNRNDNMQIRQQQAKSKKTIKLFHNRNQSNLLTSQNGVSLKQGKNKKEELFGVDFSQEYYKKLARIPKKQANLNGNGAKTYR